MKVSRNIKTFSNFIVGELLRYDGKMYKIIHVSNNHQGQQYNYLTISEI